MANFHPAEFDREVLLSNGIEAAFGVPDSSLSGLLSFFSATKPTTNHIVVASEGAAVALAAGYYLATRKVALAYVQNSGLANALNPLQSVAAKEVFGIPMLLMIGWRGKPGEKDEPQHALIGPRLLDNLRANDFPFEEVPDNLEDARAAVARLIAVALKKNTPVALIVPRKTYAEYTAISDQANGNHYVNGNHQANGTHEVNGNGNHQPNGHHELNGIHPPIGNLQLNGTGYLSGYPISLNSRLAPSKFVKATRWVSPLEPEHLELSREAVIRHASDFITSADTTVSSLGGNSRELYMILKEKGQSLSQNFFCIGGMGHSFALAQGVAIGLASQSHRVWCLDGDGSFLMHLGNNAVLAGLSQYCNVVHVVIYNGVYSSTGSQPLQISPNQFLDLAEGLPYQQKVFVDTALGLRAALSNATGGTLIVAVTNEDVSDSLPRPSETSIELKDMFLEHIERLALQSTR